jgi:hypothetical protein
MPHPSGVLSGSGPGGATRWTPAGLGDLSRPMTPISRPHSAVLSVSGRVGSPEGSSERLDPGREPDHVHLAPPIRLTRRAGHPRALSVSPSEGPLPSRRPVRACAPVAVPATACQRAQLYQAGGERRRCATVIGSSRRAGARSPAGAEVARRAGAPFRPDREVLSRGVGRRDEGRLGEAVPGTEVALGFAGHRGGHGHEPDRLPRCRTRPAGARGDGRGPAAARPGRASVRAAARAAARDPSGAGAAVAAVRRPLVLTGCPQVRNGPSTRPERAA